MGASRAAARLRPWELPLAAVRGSRRLVPPSLPSPGLEALPAAWEGTGAAKLAPPETRRRRAAGGAKRCASARCRRGAGAPGERAVASVGRDVSPGQAGRTPCRTQAQQRRRRGGASLALLRVCGTAPAAQPQRQECARVGGL